MSLQAHLWLIFKSTISHSTWLLIITSTIRELDWLEKLLEVVISSIEIWKIVCTRLILTYSKDHVLSIRLIGGKYTI